MIRSRVGPKAQTTIPLAVRTALHLDVGDEVEFAIEGDRVILSRVGVPKEDPFGLFAEWSSEGDRRGYASL